MSKWGGWRLGATHYSGTPCPCHCEGVENVVVRLRQSRTICLRAFARSAFYLLDRHALLAMNPSM